MRNKLINRLGLFTLALLLALTFTQSGRAEHLPFKIYTTAEGLAHDSVNKIARDSRGFLWFCTAEGLSRFDGYRFKNYTQDEGLPHRNVNDFLETQDGKYLVATSMGLSVFNPRGKAYRWNMIESKLEQTTDEPPLFQTFLPPVIGVTQPARDLSLAQKQTVKIYSLAQDRQGRIWAGTGNGIFQIRMTGEGLEFQEIEVENWKDKGLPVMALCADSEGGLFVGTEVAVYWISPRGDLRKLMDVPSTRSIMQDRDGNLWMDVFTEVKLFSFENHRLKLLNSYSQKDGFPTGADHFTISQTSNGRIFVGFEYGFSEFLPNAKANEPKFRLYAVEKINSLAEDGAGNLWIGTDTKGAWKLAQTGFALFGEQDGISQTQEIMSVFADREGEVYAVIRPNKLSHLTGEKFETVLPQGLTKRSWGWHLLDHLSGDGEWWIPAEDGLRRYPKLADFADLARTPPKKIYTVADGLFINSVFNQFEDSRGDIWFTQGGDIVRWERKTGRMIPYTARDGLPTGNGAISYAEDSHGNIWFGFYFGGLARYRNGKIRLFTEEDGLPSSQVSDLLADSSGRLWIATSGRGLLRLDDTEAEQPVFTNFSTANGLSSNHPICLTEDRFGRIYVGTGRGINRIDSNGNIKVFTQEDGLPSNYITRAAADKNGNLWFVARNTVVRFVPEIEQTTSPPVFIDRILVNGVPQNISQLGETETRPLELESTQRQIQVDFFALTFGDSENIRYQYRLDEQDWSAPIKQQTLNFDLAPGQHRLLVRAIRTDGIASEKPAIIAVGILPPLWLRWWFMSVVALLIASAVYAFVRYRYRRMKALFEAQEALRRSREERLAELERVRKRIATDLHDDIGSSLTQISILSEVVRQKTDANDAQLSAPLSMIAGASRELIDSMSDIVWAINPQKDHLYDLAQRMRRFASDVLTARNIAFEFGEPDEENDVPLGANIRREVFLIFKESVNNLVRHSACTEVKIDFQIADGALKLTVRDNGKGFDISQDSEGHGLSSMRRRAEGIGGRLEMTSRRRQGTTIILELPIIHQA